MFMDNVDPETVDLPIAPTGRDTIFEAGTAEVYRFRHPDGGRDDAPPVVLVPSLINRWYVLDLRPGASLVESLVDNGFDVYCIDWGIPNDEDRYLSWDDILDRMRHCVNAVKRRADADEVGMLGYCMGGTLTAIHCALHPDDIAAYVSLTAPVDFSEGGLLATLVDEKWFDADDITAAGNLQPSQMQTGFVTLRPTGQISKWVTLADRADNPEFVESFKILETWVNDNIPFPADAYRTYISELYQDNDLYEGRHYVNGHRVDLGNFDSPLLTIAADHDNICPPEAARPINDLAGSEDTEFFTVPGGHVGAVVGSKGPRELYPKISEWFGEKLN